jgi:hypothetical protein
MQRIVESNPERISCVFRPGGTSGKSWDLSKIILADYKTFKKASFKKKFRQTFFQNFPKF